MTLHWTYEKPKEEGYYMICNGDVVVHQNMEPVEIKRNIEGKLFILDFNNNLISLDSISSSWKYAALNKALMNAETI